MKVDVEIEGPAETLNDDDGAAAAVGDTVMSCATPQEPEHGVPGVFAARMPSAGSIS